jgi:hypothetical protein
MNENNTWAVKCYGWMRLSDSQFENINGVVDISFCSRWVIVKDYISTPTDSSHIHDIFDNFRIPQKAKMIPRDVRAENYKESKFFDLGQTITYPHPEWTDFAYDWFYENTVHCVEYWELNDKSPPLST